MHKTGMYFTRGVSAVFIFHEQMISLVRESNDSPSEFLHPRTCVTEKVFTWPRSRDISWDTKASSTSISGSRCDMSSNYCRSKLPLFFYVLRVDPKFCNIDIPSEMLKVCYDLRFWQSLELFQSCRVSTYMILRLSYSF